MSRSLDVTDVYPFFECTLNNQQAMSLQHAPGSERILSQLPATKHVFSLAYYFK